MRLCSYVLTALIFLASPAFAQDVQMAPTPKGLWLTTDFPALAVRSGETAVIKMKMQNSGMPPGRLELSVTGLPSGWKANIFGDGQPVDAVMPAPSTTVNLELRIDVPANTPPSTHKFSVTATGSGQDIKLPLQVAVGRVLPAKLELKAKLPALQGTVTSDFDYEFTLENSSGRSLIISLTAETPPNFHPSFTESYGNQELTSVPLESGKSKDLKFKVAVPGNATAGKYALKVRAVSQNASVDMPLLMTITGTAKLSVAGKEGRVSADAESGEESQIEVEVSNTGSAPANNVKLKASPPDGWKVEFNPNTIPLINPEQTVTVSATIKPTEKAIAGDYMTKIEASAGGETGEVDFRVAVKTSTLWGIVGIAFIAIALLVLVGAVGRFGRR